MMAGYLTLEMDTYNRDTVGSKLCNLYSSCVPVCAPTVFDL